MGKFGVRANSMSSNFVQLIHLTWDADSQSFCTVDNGVGMPTRVRFDERALEQLAKMLAPYLKETAE